MTNPKASRYQYHSTSHGRDGGFITYFFGNPASTSDSASSRSNSHVRPEGLATSKDGLSRLNISRQPHQESTIPMEWSEPNREDIEIELIRSLIYSYFSITRKTIADLIPKTLMHLIVNHAKENIQNRLVTTLYKEDMFSDLLLEDEQILAGNPPDLR